MGKTKQNSEQTKQQKKEETLLVEEPAANETLVTEEVEEQSEEQAFIAHKKELMAKAFTNLYGKANRKYIEHLIADIKADIENIPGVDGFITSRVKSPLSILHKYDTETKYSHSWNEMKDLLGLMVVVDTNQDVDSILYHMNLHYQELKNPYASQFFRDFRKTPIRTIEENGKPIIVDLPSPKGYQINDGYKNCRINMMIKVMPDDYTNGIPIEIQVKTKEQYIAHMATHDPVYKAKSIQDETICHYISDKLFPYFEAVAHLKLRQNTMTTTEIDTCKKDIESIFERNKEVFEKYPDIFNEACSIFATYVFVTKNYDKLYANAILDDSIINNQLLESEILRIFHYKQKEFLKNDKSLTDSKAFMKTAEYIMNMDYNDFVQLSQSLAGDYRKEVCIIAGIFDMIREKDIKLIERCAKSFRRVVVSVYDDDLAELYLGVKPMYSLQERMNAVEMLDDVASVSVVDISGIVSDKAVVEPFIIDDPKPKKYSIGYLPGVFDMFHPGHMEYIKAASDLCDKLIIGVKSNDYSWVYKGKLPVQDENERLCIANALVGIGDVCLTNRDIMPPVNVLAELSREANAGKKVTIFLGSDWKPYIDKTEPKKGKEKSKMSLGEYEMLTQLYPNIQLDMIPRGNSGRSSTNYRKRGMDAANFENPHELKTLGV